MSSLGVDPLVDGLCDLARPVIRNPRFEAVQEIQGCKVRYVRLEGGIDPESSSSMSKQMQRLLSERTLTMARLLENRTSPQLC